MNVCATCVHSHQAPIDPANIGADRQMFCHRYPPAAFPMPVGRNMAAIIVRPVVQQSDSCGEYSGKGALQ